jgi:hypothetical protein
MACEQFLVHAELQRQEARAEELRVQLEQAFERGVDLAGRALGLRLSLALIAALPLTLCLALCALPARLLLSLRALVAAPWLFWRGGRGSRAWRGSRGSRACCAGASALVLASAPVPASGPACSCFS